MCVHARACRHAGSAYPFMEVHTHRRYVESNETMIFACRALYDETEPLERENSRIFPRKIIATAHPMFSICSSMPSASTNHNNRGFSFASSTRSDARASVPLARDHSPRPLNDRPSTIHGSVFSRDYFHSGTVDSVRKEFLSINKLSEKDWQETSRWIVDRRRSSRKLSCKFILEERRLSLSLFLFSLLFYILTVFFTIFISFRSRTEV